MSIVRWNPFDEMDNFLRSYQTALAKNTAQEGMVSTDWRPSVDITENDQEFLIKAELPEVKKDDIKIQVDNGVLTLSGERKTEKKDEKEHRIERFYGCFSRSFSLPDNVNESDIRAESKEGMLYLHLPKIENPKPKSIEISIG